MLQTSPRKHHASLRPQTSSSPSDSPAQLAALPSYAALSPAFASVSVNDATPTTHMTAAPRKLRTPSPKFRSRRRPPPALPPHPCSLSLSRSRSPSPTPLTPSGQSFSLLSAWMRYHYTMSPLHRRLLCYVSLVFLMHSICAPVLIFCFFSSNPLSRPYGICCSFAVYPAPWCFCPC